MNTEQEKIVIEIVNTILDRAATDCRASGDSEGAALIQDKLNILNNNEVVETPTPTDSAEDSTNIEWY